MLFLIKTFRGFRYLISAILLVCVVLSMNHSIAAGNKGNISKSIGESRYSSKGGIQSRGIVGTWGYPGVAGPGGYPGVAGYGGYYPKWRHFKNKGYSGIEGNAAYSGIPGGKTYSGIAGSNGYPGISGNKSYSGIQGSGSYPGIAGSDSYPGIPGD